MLFDESRKDPVLQLFVAMIRMYIFCLKLSCVLFLSFPLSFAKIVDCINQYQLVNLLLLLMDS